MHLTESLRKLSAKLLLPLNKMLCLYGKLYTVPPLPSQDILIALESRRTDDTKKKLIVSDAWQTLNMFYFFPLHNHPSALLGAYEQKYDL